MGVPWTTPLDDPVDATVDDPVDDAATRWFGVNHRASAPARTLTRGPRCDARRQALAADRPCADGPCADEQRADSADGLHADALKTVHVDGRPDVRRGPRPAFARDAVASDDQVRELTKSLVRRDLELGRLAAWLQKADAWRRLGFANEAHYVRERMGLGFSQWKLKRLIARRLGDFPALEAAVWRGEIGLEAATLLIRVITCALRQRGPERDAIGRQWLERARTSTFKHLREEVQAAELAAQQWDVPALPPSEEEMRQLLPPRAA